MISDSNGHRRNGCSAVTPSTPSTPARLDGLGAFLRAYVRSPLQVGALWPSSRRLAAAMTQWVNWDRVRVVVEFGAGTGALTPAILKSAAADCRVLLIERDARMAASLKRQFGSANVVHGDVQSARAYCDEAGIDRADVVISSLPWASLTPVVQARCMKAAKTILHRDGFFATYAHLQSLMLPGGRRLNRILPRVFDCVERSPIVWRNSLPAFVYQCRGPMQRVCTSPSQTKQKNIYAQRAAPHHTPHSLQGGGQGEGLS